MRNNNKSPKSGNDRALGKGKSNERRQSASGKSEYGGKNSGKDAKERSIKPSGKPDFNKFSKGADSKPAGNRFSRSANDDTRDFKRNITEGRDSGNFAGKDKRSSFRPDGDREANRPYQAGNKGRSNFNDRSTGKFSSNKGGVREGYEKRNVKDEQDYSDYRPEYKLRLKLKDYGDKQKRDYFEKKSKWDDKAGKEGGTFEKKKPEGRYAKPVTNTRQHNPSGKSGSPRYNFDKEGAKPSKSAPVNKANESKDNSTIRLNRYIANSGICSRREADELISTGQILVNGKVMKEMGYQVKKSDTVKYGKKILNPEKLVYVLMNKPKDYITTMEDPEDRKTVMDLLEGAFPERVYPVGRLDRNTTGLLLLTNDGELADKLTHPSYNTRKIYQAELDKPFTVESFEKLKEGIELEDGFIKPDELAIITPDAYVVGIEIHSGKNRIVRRIFENLGYDVKKLDRTVFANLNKKDLPRGKWRFLTEKEVIGLKFLS